MAAWMKWLSAACFLAAIVISGSGISLVERGTVARPQSRVVLQPSRRPPERDASVAAQGWLWSPADLGDEVLPSQVLLRAGSVVYCTPVRWHSAPVARLWCARTSERCEGAITQALANDGSAAPCEPHRTLWCFANVAGDRDCSATLHDCLESRLFLGAANGAPGACVRRYAIRD